MAPKSVRTSRSSSAPAYFSKYFSYLEQKNRFNREYATNEILISYFLDAIIFKDSEFIYIFEDTNMRSFISDAPREIYPTLVRMFLANLR